MTDTFSPLAFRVGTVVLSAPPAPLKLSPEDGVKLRGTKHDLQMSWLTRYVLLEGGVVVARGVYAWDSVVICVVLRCNCSISNNVVRLAVQIR